MDLETEIVTFKGHMVDLFTGPKPDQVDIYDIAHHLSLQCRYAGACRHFYSTAEHCIYVAKMANKMHAMYYLLHDSHETWYQDMTRPCKNLLLKLGFDGYDKLLDECDKIVYPTLGFPYEYYENLKKDVKEIDLFVYRLERKMLFGAANRLGLREDHALHGAQFGMSPIDAENAFLEMFNSLM